MKTIFTIIAFFTFLIGFSQNGDLIGHVSDRQDGANFPGVAVELSKNGKVIYEAQTDFDGNFAIKNVEFGQYEFKLNCCGNQSLIIKEFYFSTIDKVFEFIYPSPCKESVKLCPENHSDNLIPIVYGLPEKKLIKASKKGKVMLGGCVITDCSPKWFCTKHKLTF